MRKKVAKNLHKENSEESPIDEEIDLEAEESEESSHTNFEEAMDDGE
jgi:hypothetical protein